MTRTNDRLPRLTDDERRANLGKAMEVRHERAEYRARIKAGEVTLEQALADQSQTVQRMRVKALLTALPGIGQAKAERVMGDIGIDHNRRVKGLGAQQRRRLIEWWELVCAARR